MKERTTQLLLVIVSVVLAAHLFQIAPESAIARPSASDEVPGVLRARLIELVDERGTVRASLRTTSDGAVTFRMMDAKGTIRVKLGAQEGGSGLALLDERTEPAVHFACAANRYVGDAGQARKGEAGYPALTSGSGMTPVTGESPSFSQVGRSRGSSVRDSNQQIEPTFSFSGID